MHVYPSYRLCDVLNEYFYAFKFLLDQKMKFQASDRLEQIQISLAPNLKKEQFSNLISRYSSIIESRKPINSATINKDRDSLRKLLKK